MKLVNIISSQVPDLKTREVTIAKARTTELGATKEEVLEGLFSWAKSKSLTALTRATLDAAFDVAEATPRYGSPRSVWGMVNGLTEFSQKSGHTDIRTELDAQAGRLMEIPGNF